MKKYVPSMVASLLFSLFIYVFYRTDKTLVNEVVKTFFSYERYAGLKDNITSMLPLNEYVVYSLPEGLWVFCITLTSSFFYLQVQDRKWSLVFAPILLAVLMELFQLLQITNGRFDLMDIFFATGFWLLAVFWTRNNPVGEPLFRSFNIRSACCMMSYSIVYLSHVIR